MCGDLVVTEKSKAMKSTEKKIAVKSDNGKNHVEAKAPKEGTLNRFIFDCLENRVTDDVIEKRIKQQFPKSNFKISTLNGYRRDLHAKYGLKLS